MLLTVFGCAPMASATLAYPPNPSMISAKVCMPSILQKADQKSKPQNPDLQTLFLQIAGMERNDRLKLARERHFRTAKEAATSLGVPYGTYSGHEAGTRGIKDAEMTLYARRFRVPLAWLAYGTGDSTETTPTVAIVGKIGANAQPDAVLFANQGEGYAFDYDAPVPPNYSESTRALEVEGGSMRNTAKDGWLVYYDEAAVQQPPTPELFGDLCVCWLEDGRQLLKELQPGADGLFDLESTNAPTIRDVGVRAATRVTSIVPRGRRPKTDNLETSTRRSV